MAGSLFHVLLLFSSRFFSFLLVSFFFFHFSSFSLSLSSFSSSSLLLLLLLLLLLSILFVCTQRNGINLTNDSTNEERRCTMTHGIERELSLCQSLPCLDMVGFPVLRHIEPQAPLPVVVWVETIPLCQRHAFATGLRRPCSFPDTSGTRKIQKTASANDCFNVLDKCSGEEKKGPSFSLLKKPFNCRSLVSFSRSLASFRTVLCFAEIVKNLSIGRNTQKQHLQNSDHTLTNIPRKKPTFEHPAKQLLKKPAY